MPVKAVYTGSKVSFLRGIRILGIITRHTKTDNVSELIIIDVVTNYTKFIAKMLYIGEIRGNTTIPMLNVVKTDKIIVFYHSVIGI